MQVSAIAVKKRGTRLVWVAWLLLSAFLLLFPAILPLDGKPHADWQQFLGRFHPLAVHFPIALILLVPVLEMAGRSRPALREAAGFVLSLSVFACFAAAILGYLLAYGSGESGAGIVRHMCGGIGLTLAVLACVWMRSSAAYSWLLGSVVVLLLFTAHQGGSVAYGDGYLTKYLPRPLQQMFTREKAQPPQFPNSMYARRIYPALQAKCVSCHGEAKVKGNLRLDSYNFIMRGGEDGAVVIPGDPERSRLVQRVTLPHSDKKFMPSDGKPPLTLEEIASLRAWIAQGASPER